MMKITSSTSITSISGVMLMSLIGCDAGALEAAEGHGSRGARAGSVQHHLAQVVREAFELGLAGGDPLAEEL
jgi:hypothetical protein